MGIEYIYWCGREEERRKEKKRNKRKEGKKEGRERRGGRRERGISCLPEEGQTRERLRVLERR